MPELYIVLPGRCPTKGSLRPIQRDSGGVYMEDAGVVWQHKSMRDLKDAWHGAPLLAEPVSLALTVHFARPKKSKYAHPMPDIDKLCRRVLDALTGTVLQDDKWVVRLTAAKEWGEQDAVMLSLHTIRIITIGGGYDHSN